MTFVENVNRELSSDQFTTVAVKETNEVVGFPDGMAVDEMENAIEGDRNGVIKPWKRSFYEKNIREPLAKLGMDAFQPKFITEQKPSADRAFATAFAQGALMDTIKPHFSKEEQAAYYLNPGEVVRDPGKMKELFTDPMKRASFAGSLAGMLTGFGAVSAALKTAKFGLTANRIAGASTQFMGQTKVATVAYKAISSSVQAGVTAGVYRGISETSHALDQEHPDMAKVGKAVFHDMAWFGLSGALTASFSKYTGVATSAGIGYSMSKVDGASEPDALLNAFVFGGLHLVGVYGEDPIVRRDVAKGFEKGVTDYISKKNPLIDPNVAAQAGREQVFLKAEQVLADLKGKDNIVRGKDGKPLELNVDAQGNDAVIEVLKSKDTTVKLVDEFAKDIVDPGESPQAAQRNAKETKIAVDQYRTAWKRANESKNVAAMDRANKGLERNKEIPMFESNSQADPYGRKIAANPEQIKKVEDHVAKMKEELDVLKKEDAQDTEISEDRFNNMSHLATQISLSNDVLRIAKIDKIPDFKTTDEAVKFGEDFAGNPHISKMLEKASIEVNAKLDEAPVGQEGMDLGARAVLLTEAIRASKGQLTREKAKAAIEKLKAGEEAARMEVIINDPAVIKARETAASITETFTINTPERQAMREKLAVEGYGTGAKVKNRRVDIVLGGPASGKSQVVKPLVDQHGSMVIDSDIYKEKIPEYAGGLGAAAVHKESSNIVEGAILDKALKAGDNIVYPRLGKNPKEIKRLIDLFNENGYEVHLHNVELPVAKAMERSITRFQEHGRFVDPLFVKQVGLQPRETYGMLKTDKGVKTYGSYSADVPKGKAPEVIERSGEAGSGERSLQRADGNQDAGTQRGPTEVSKSQRKLNKARFPAKDKETLSFISDLLFSSERGQAIISGEGQYSRLKSGWPTFLSNKGYTAKELQGIFSKVATGKKLTDKQAGIARDILNDYDAINTNTEKAVVEAEAWVKDFRARFPEVTDQQIKKIEEEINKEDLWNEEKYQTAVERYLAKDTGSQASAEGVSENEVKITRKKKNAQAQQEFDFETKPLPPTEGDIKLADAQTVIALRKSPLAVSFKENGYLTFPDKEVTHPADIAFAFHHLTNSGVEHFYTVAMKGNKVLNVELITVGDYQSASPSQFELFNLLEAKKADGIYIIHNHPTGVVKPSPEDLAYTRRAHSILEARGIKLHGHIIIDTQNFTYIGKDGGTESFSHKEYAETKQVSVLKKHFEWKQSKDTLGPSILRSEDMYEIAKGTQMDPTHAMVVGLDGQYRIMSMSVLPREILSSGKVMELMTAGRTGYAMLVNSGKTRAELRELGVILHDARIKLLDSIEKIGDKYISYSNGEIKEGNDPYGKDRKNKLPKEVTDLSTNDLEALILKRYEAGVSQRELDLLETEFAKRVTEENLFMSEEDPNMREADNMGSDLTEALIDTYSRYLKASKEGSFNGTDAKDIRANFLGVVQEISKIPPKETATNDQAFEAAKDLYEHKQKLLERQRSNRASNLTPSGEIRLELQAPIKKELFQEEGELFRKPKLGSESGKAIIPGVDIAAEKISEATTPENLQNVYQRVFNRFQSIEDLPAKARKMGAVIKPGEDPGISADRYLSTANQAESVLRVGTYRITRDGRVVMTGEGLKPILDEYSKKYKGEAGEKDLNTYLISRRFIEDLQRPKSQFSSENIARPSQVKKAQEDLAALNKKHGNLNEFESTAQRIYDYQKRVLENLVEAEVLSPEKLAMILDKNPHYVPFDRIMPEEPIAGGTPISKKPFSQVRSPIKKIKGSDLEIADPIESIIKNTYRIMDAANRNKVFKDIYALKDIEGLGLNAKRPDFKAIEVTAEETGSTDITIFRPSQFIPKGNVVEGFVKGKRKYLEVEENVKQAMTGMNDQSSSLVAKLLSYPATWLRTGATLTPEFIMRNPIRDQWTALLQTQVGYRPFVDAGGAIADIMGRSKIYNEWIQSGGSYAGFVELSRPALEKMAADLRGKPDLLKNLNIVTKLQDISQLMEQATRLGIYKAALRKGLTPVEAATQSRESTINFARRGSQTKDANAVIAFFNAGVQGLDKSIRTVAKDPKGFTLKALATITVPSLLLYLKNRQDEDYAELPRWQKDLFWMTKIGDTWWRIPKPFLYGQLFGSIPERFMEYLDTKDARAFNQLENSLYNALSPIAGDPMSGLLPTAIKPLIENMTNWSFFRDRNIVPDSKKRLIPSEQFSDYDTETAKLLGAILNVSPSKIENLVSGWLGGSGRYTLQAGDQFMNMVDKIKGKPSEEKKPIEKTDLPLVKGFASKTPSGYQSESVQRFYNEREKITALQLTHRKYEKDQDFEKADKFLRNNPSIDFYLRANRVADQIADINKDIESVSKDPDLSDNQKRKLIEGYKEEMTDLAREFNKELKTK